MFFLYFIRTELAESFYVGHGNDASGMKSVTQISIVCAVCFPSAYPYFVMEGIT